MVFENFISTTFSKNLNFIVVDGARKGCGFLSPIVLCWDWESVDFSGLCGAGGWGVLLEKPGRSFGK